MDGGLDELAARRRPSWRRAAPRLAGFALFGVVAAALLAAVGLIFATLETERAQRAQMERTGAVLAALGDVRTAVLNAETGQRGYVITADRRYLEPYEGAQLRYPLAIARIERLLGRTATPRERVLLRRLEGLAGAKFAELAETIALVERGEMVEAQVRILGDEGKATMDRMRGVLAELEAGERRQLDTATAAAVAAEARIVPLLGLLLAGLLVALGLGLWQVVRAARAEVAAAQAQALGEARDRADLLARELNHRVKNLFAVVLAIVKLSARDVPAAKPVVDKISSRIHALAAAHKVTQGATGSGDVDLRELIATAIAPYRSDRARCILEGDALVLPEKLAAPLGLVLHELVTNAVKYGALAHPGGLLRVEWRREGAGIRLDWREQGPAAQPQAGLEGFGSMLMTSSARQIGGTIERTFHDDGIAVRMRFPA